MALKTQPAIFGNARLIYHIIILQNHGTLGSTLLHTSNDKVDQKSDSHDDDPFAPKDSVNSKPSTSNDKGAQKSVNRNDDPFASKDSISPKHSTSNDKVTQKSDNRDNDPFPPKDCIKPEPSAPNEKVALARDNNDYDPSAPKTSTLNYKAIEILSYDDIISKEMAVKEVLEEQDSQCNRSDTTLEPDELEAVDANEYVPVYARNVALQLLLISTTNSLKESKAVDMGSSSLSQNQTWFSLKISRKICLNPRHWYLQPQRWNTFCFML